MRTKALLLAAAFAAAGVATSMAQVYSVNAVGYVNKTLVPGFNLISNPLEAANNTIGSLFRNFQGGTPDGLTVYVFANGGFVTAQYEGLDDVWSPEDVAARTLLPGDGVFVFVPAGGGNRTLTFVGQVPQGPTTTAIPRGFSIKSAVVPQAGALDSFKNTDGTYGGIPATDGDLVYRYNTATKGYVTFQYEGLDNVWSPALPSMDVGEAFFYFTSTAKTWNRTFSVNNPT